MLTLIINFFRHPFPLFDDRKAKWATILLPGLFVALFLNIFQPFTIHNPDWNLSFMFILSGYGLIGSLVLGFNELVVWPKFRKRLLKGQWTIGKNLLWFSWHAFTLSFGIYAYWKYWCCGLATIPDMEGYPLMLFRTFAIGIFPVSALMGWQWIWSLRQEADRQSDRVEAPRDPIITFTSEYHNEQLRLSSSKVLFLESADNYVAIHFLDKDGLSKKLIRSSLSRIEEELKNFPNFLRCHRSFLINLDQVQYVKGNSKSLFVFLKHLKEPIPVARKKAREINHAFKRLPA